MQMTCRVCLQALAIVEGTRERPPGEAAMGLLLLLLLLLCGCRLLVGYFGDCLRPGMIGFSQITDIAVCVQRSAVGARCVQTGAAFSSI